MSNRPKYRLVVKPKDGSKPAEEVGVFWQSKIDGCLNFQSRVDSEMGKQIEKLLSGGKDGSNYVNAWENKPKGDEEF